MGIEKTAIQTRRFEKKQLLNIITSIEQFMRQKEMLDYQINEIYKRSELSGIPKRVLKIVLRCRKFSLEDFKHENDLVLDILNLLDIKDA